MRARVRVYGTQHQTPRTGLSSDPCSAPTPPNSSDREPRRTCLPHSPPSTREGAPNNLYLSLPQFPSPVLNEPQIPQEVGRPNSKITPVEPDTPYGRPRGSKSDSAYVLRCQGMVALEFPLLAGHGCYAARVLGV